MSKPWKLRVDWLLQDAYGDPVSVELHVMDEDPKELRKFPDVARALDWALNYMLSRGTGYWCDIDNHQRRDDKHITLHAIGNKTPQAVEQLERYEAHRKSALSEKS